MKKSELRELIREVLQEELTKMNSSLTESSVVDRRLDDEPLLPEPSGNTSYDDIANSLLIDPNFTAVVESPDDLQKEAAQNYVRSAVDSAYPTEAAQRKEQIVVEVSRKIFDMLDPFSDTNLPSYEGEISSITKLKQDYFDEHSDTYDDTFDL
jgi:hypothetical protein